MIELYSKNINFWNEIKYDIKRYERINVESKNKRERNNHYLFIGDLLPEENIDTPYQNTKPIDSSKINSEIKLLTTDYSSLFIIKETISNDQDCNQLTKNFLYKENIDYSNALIPLNYDVRYINEMSYIFYIFDICINYINEIMRKSNYLYLLKGSMDKRIVINLEVNYKEEFNEISYISKLFDNVSISQNITFELMIILPKYFLSKIELDYIQMIFNINSINELYFDEKILQIVNNFQDICREKFIDKLLAYNYEKPEIFTMNTKSKLYDHIIKSISRLESSNEHNYKYFSPRDDFNNLSIYGTKLNFINNIINLISKTNSNEIEIPNIEHNFTNEIKNKLSFTDKLLNINYVHSYIPLYKITSKDDLDEENVVSSVCQDIYDSAVLFEMKRIEFHERTNIVNKLLYIEKDEHSNSNHNNIYKYHEKCNYKINIGRKHKETVLNEKLIISDNYTVDNELDKEIQQINESKYDAIERSKIKLKNDITMSSEEVRHSNSKYNIVENQSKFKSTDNSEVSNLISTDIEKLSNKRVLDIDEQSIKRSKTIDEKSNVDLDFNVDNYLEMINNFKSHTIINNSNTNNGNTNIKDDTIIFDKLQKTSDNLPLLLVENINIIVSADFLEKNPIIISQLVMKYKITYTDCNIDFPIDLIIDVNTAVTFMPINTIYMNHFELKEYFRKLIGLVYKYDTIYILILHNQITHTTDKNTDNLLKFYQSLANVPIKIFTKQIYLSNDPQNNNNSDSLINNCVHVIHKIIYDNAMRYHSSKQLHKYKNRNYLLLINDSKHFTYRCEFLQLFPTINIFLAAYLLSHWKLCDLPNIKLNDNNDIKILNCNILDLDITKISSFLKIINIQIKKL